MASCSSASPPCSTSSAFLLSISLSSACSFRSFSSSSFCASSSDFSLFAARRALMAAMRSRASCSCLARSFSKLQQKQGYFVKTKKFPIKRQKLSGTTSMLLYLLRDWSKNIASPSQPSPWGWGGGGERGRKKRWSYAIGNTW